MVSMSERLKPGQTQENTEGKPKSFSKTLTLGKKVLDATYYRQSYMQYGVEGKALIVAQKMWPLNIELTVATLALLKLGMISMTEEQMGFRGYFNVGNHMSIHPSGYHAFKERELSDGAIIHPGQKLGVIDLLRNIPILDSDTKLLTATRHLYNSVSQDLHELAFLCQSNDPRLNGVEAFYGISHFAGYLAERLGFDSFKLRNPLKRLFPKVIEKQMVKEHAGENKDWKKIKNKNKDIYEAFISRQKLVDRFGTQTNLYLHSHGR